MQEARRYLLNLEMRPLGYSCFIYCDIEGILGLEKDSSQMMNDVVYTSISQCWALGDIWQCLEMVWDGGEGCVTGTYWVETRDAAKGGLQQGIIHLKCYSAKPAKPFRAF